MFRSSFAENIFRGKYALTPTQTWAEKARDMVYDVCGGPGFGRLAPVADQDEVLGYIWEMKFLPAGRYIYYAGRAARFFNNCFMLRGESDTREEWGELINRATSCLMTGGGIGVDYSEFRPKGATLVRTGGTSSGPIPLMQIINEVGRNVCQGGSRRSAVYASLNWQHEDIQDFLVSKNWADMPIGNAGYTVADAKHDDFNYPAPLDVTNISPNYDDEWLAQINAGELPETYIQNVRQALRTGEPGFSFNFGVQQNETLRNACSELVSSDDSDVCNLGSVNMGAITDLDEFRDVVRAGMIFLLCGSIKAQLPYPKVAEVRRKNRRVGLGLMGVHEWLLQRGYRYEVVPELHRWLEVYRDESRAVADSFADYLGVSRPVGCRAVAPTGTIGILAGTTTGIEPLFAVAYKRRYLQDLSRWKYEYVVDSTAEVLIKTHGLNPEEIETANDLALDPERRIKFQYDVQKYVDHAISSTINLPEWGSEANNEDHVLPFARTLAKYAHGLRGFTCYPDGARGGQPITAVSYADAITRRNTVFEENSSCRDGVCGV